MYHDKHPKSFVVQAAAVHFNQALIWLSGPPMVSIQIRPPVSPPVQNPSCNFRSTEITSIKREETIFNQDFYFRFWNSYGNHFTNPKEDLKAPEDVLPPVVSNSKLVSNLSPMLLRPKASILSSTKFKDEEMAALLKVLKSHKRAIAWKLSDIKGVSPEFCTHKILMEEDYEPSVQSQRRISSTQKIKKRPPSHAIRKFAYSSHAFGLCYAFWQVPKMYDGNLPRMIENNDESIHG
ncbi:hypothetical protein Tco_1133398 [Tanacetum coccineum]